MTFAVKSTCLLVGFLLLGTSALAETAAMDTTVPGVESLIQRAMATLKTKLHREGS